MQYDDIIAVDGPAASGKSVCEVVARELHLALLSTGPIYRIITLEAQRKKVPLYDKAAMTDLTSRVLGSLAYKGNTLTFHEVELGDEINDPDVTKMVPSVSKQPEVRRLVLPLQRQFNGGKAIIAEGRDMTSVVFPNAVLKIYLTATRDMRACRRFLQDIRKYPDSVTLTGTLEAIRIRDHEDETRTEAPLIRVPDAVLIDSTFLSKREVADKIIELYSARVE